MKKFVFLSILILFSCLLFNTFAYSSDEYSEWDKALDVYNSDGLDRPVSAVEYKKMMKELQELKDKSKKKKKFWEPKDPVPIQQVPTATEKTERNDIVKITTPLYYDGHVVPVGFYKITSGKSGSDYFVNLMQGKTKVITVKATKVSHMDFCADKVNCLETLTYKDKYYRINLKTIDYALSAYLTLMN